MKQLFAALLSTLLLLVVMLLVGLMFLLGTPTGSHFLLQQVPNLQTQEIEGSILGGLTLGQLRYDDGKQAAEVENAEFKLDWSVLAARRVQINHLRAKRVRYTPPASPASETQTDFKLPDIQLPVQIQVDDVQLDEFVLQQPENAFTVRDIKAELRTEGHHLQVYHLQATPLLEDKPLTLGLKGKADLLTPHELAVDLDVDGQLLDLGTVQAALALNGVLEDYQLAGGVHLQSEQIPVKQADIKAQGNLQQIHFEPLSLHVLDGNAKVQGKVVWVPDLHWDVTVKASEINPEPYAKDFAGKVQLDIESTGGLEAYTLKGTSQLEISSLPIQSLAIDGTGDLDALGFKTLTLKALDGDVEASGKVNWANTFAWELELKAEAINPEFYAKDFAGKAQLEVESAGTLEAYTVKGQSKLGIKNLPLEHVAIEGTGNLESLDFKTLKLKALEGDIEAEGEINWAKNFAWDLDLKAENIDPEFYAKDFAGKAQLDVKSRGDLDGYTVVGHSTLDIKSLPINALEIEGSGNLESLGFKRLKLKALEGDIEASGAIDWANTFAWDVDLNGKNINPEFYAKDFAGKVALKLKSAGDLEAYTVKGTSQLGIKALPLKALEIDGQGSLEQLSFQKLVLKALEGTVRSQGKVAWKPHLAWDVDVDGKGLNPGVYRKDLPGKLDLALQSEGQLKHDKINASVNLARLKGKLRHYPVEGQGQLDYENDSIRLKQVDLRSGINQLRASGQASEPFNLDWKINAKNLSQLLPELGGHLVGEGRLQGSFAKPVIDADLTGKQLRYQDYAISTLSLEAQSQGEQYNATAAIGAVSSKGEVLLKRVGFDLAGSLAAHKLSLSLKHTEGLLDVKLAGGLDQQQRWSGNLQDLALRTEKVGVWRLQSPVVIKASAKAAQLGNLCLLQNESALCAEGQWEAANEGYIQTQGKLDQVPFALFKQWLPKELSLPGSINAQWQLAKRGASQQGKLTVDLPDNRFAYHPKEGDALGLDYENVQLIADLQNQTVNAALSTLLRGQEGDLRGRLQGKARLLLAESGDVNDHQLQATVDFEMPDIAWLASFSQGQVEQLRGQLGSHLEVSGALTKPQLRGDIALDKTQLFIPVTGIMLEDVRFEIEAPTAEKALISGQLKSGEGILKLEGDLGLADLANWTARLKIRGNRVLAIDNELAVATISPDLAISANAKTVAIDGRLAIPQAHLSVSTVPESAVQESADLVILGEKVTEVKAPAVKVKPNVRVLLGDDVSFSGFGLAADLGGDISVGLSRDEEIIATGELKIKQGEYAAYGQKLAIDEGQLIFSGDPKNPGLDLRTSRSIRQGEIIVGLDIAGTLRTPESSVFSEPSLPDSDAISYLITGRPLSGVKGSESSLLIGAITSMGIDGGDSIVGEIGSELGLDLGIEAGDTLSSSQLNVGKRIGPDLYLRYVVGLFDSVSKILLNYRINKMLSVEVESGLHQGADLIYEIETN